MKSKNLFIISGLILNLSLNTIFAMTNNIINAYTSDSSNVSAGVDNSGVTHPGILPDTISAVPTFNEINNLFLLATKGDKDPFRIVSLVASRKDDAIPALEQFLFQPPDTTKDATYTGIKIPNKEYAIYALDAIATSNAEKLLMKVVRVHSDIEIRGLALKTLAFNNYYRTKNDEESGKTNGLKPNKEVVHIMLQNADDTTYINNCEEAIGKIARDGLTNWTGKDYGDVLRGEIRRKVEKRLGMTMKQSRENWWQYIQAKLYWDKNTFHFNEQ